MSTVPGPPRPARPREPRSGFLTAVMIIVGLVLLLPGLCAVIFGYAALSGSSLEPVLTFLVLTGLALGGLGIWLIWSAIRGLSR